MQPQLFLYFDHSHVKPMASLMLHTFHNSSQVVWYCRLVTENNYLSLQLISIVLQVKSYQRCLHKMQESKTLRHFPQNLPSPVDTEKGGQQRQVGMTPPPH
eukprot:TRINITY_DN32129_c1_g1_i2.p1 TRINITY_DN32129_c1_g1~~TRINITY_DN32129_c1_g1_i2.p1  ORF type:complete len:101 (-),score=4.67 TRINITY_DN32129_c1_g1_i2:74-376(-)